MLIDIDLPQEGLTRSHTGLYIDSGVRCYDAPSAEFYESVLDWPGLRNQTIDERLASLADGSYIQPYGSCDSLTQFLSTKFCEQIKNHASSFVVLFFLIRKCDQGEQGYRWRKNGPYIGEKETMCEYLADEPNVEEIYQYSVYRKIGT